MSIRSKQRFVGCKAHLGCKGRRTGGRPWQRTCPCRSASRSRNPPAKSTENDRPSRTLENQDDSRRTGERAAKGQEETVRTRPGAQSTHDDEPRS